MEALPIVKTSLSQNIFRILLGSALIFAGISHLSFARKEFQAQVPDWVPMETDLVVVLSGIVEIAIGLSLLFGGKYKAYIGWGTALFFILVFPGNISQYVNKRDGFGLDTDSARFGRLFFQPVLVLWALWSTGAWSALMEKRRLNK
jgi:uncharacterized membrane protein